MLISLLKKPAPTGLVANAKLKFNRLKWNHVHDKNEHRYYVVYAYSNLTDLNNDTNGVAIERVFENRFKDDRESLNKGDFCGYRVSEVDIYDNESYKTGPVNVTFAHVGDTDVDHTSPGLPTSLSVTFASIERDADGTIVSNSIASWAAPASGIPVKYYLVKVTQTSNSESVVYKTDATAMLFRVKAGVQYDVQVKSVNLFNDPSAYTTAVSYTRPKKVADLPAPGTVVGTPGKKRALISWPAVNDDTYTDYRITYVYRNTSTTAPVPGTTTPYRKTKGDSILDEGLTTAQNYYYWVVHKDNSGNFSALSAILGPVTSGGNEVSSFADLSGSIAGGQIPNGTITDPMTNQTAPGLVTGVTVGAGSIERDEDGTIVANTLASWTAPVGGVSVGMYRVRVTQVSNGEVEHYDTDTTSVKFRVKTGKAYNVQVRSISIFDKGSAYTTAVSYTRAKKTSDVPAPGTVTATPGKKRALISWPQVNDDTYPDYRITYIYRSTTTTAPVLGTTTPYRKTKGDSILDEGLTTAQNYYYWVAHKDNSGNFGAISAMLGPVVSGGNEVSTFSDLTGTVAGSQIAAGRSTNLLINTNANLGTAYWAEIADTGGANTFSALPLDAAWAPRGERCFQIEQLSNVTTGYTTVGQVDETGVARRIPVKANQRYELHLLTGNHRCIGRAFIIWYDSSGNAVGSPVTNDNVQQSAGGLLLSGYKQIGCFATAPGTAAYAQIWIRKLNTTLSSDTSSYMFFTHVFFGEAGANQTEYSAWAENGNLITTDATTDQRAPTMPTTLSVTFGSIEIDDDGKSVANVVATWVQPSTPVPAAWYRVAVTQNSTGEVRIFDTENLSITFDVKTNKQYDVKVRAISAFDKRSAYTTAVSYTRPKKSALPTAPTGVSIVQKANGNMVKWTAPADKDVAYYNVYVGTTNVAASATKVDSTFATYYLDQTVRTVGTGYYYFVTSVDRSGNESSTRVAASNNPQTYRQTTSAEIGTNQVTTTQVAPDAITSTELAAAAVIPDSYKTNPAGSMLIDYELLDPAEWKFTEYAQQAGGSGSFSTNWYAGTVISGANLVWEDNPPADGLGGSTKRFKIKASEKYNGIVIESVRPMPFDQNEYVAVAATIKLLNSGVEKTNSIKLYLRRWDWNGSAYVPQNWLSTPPDSVNGIDLDSTTVNQAQLLNGIDAGSIYPMFTILIIVDRSTAVVSGGGAWIPECYFAAPSVKNIGRLQITQLLLTGTNVSTVDFGTSAGGALIARVMVEPNAQAIERYKKIKVDVSFMNKSGSNKQFGFKVWWDNGTGLETTLINVGSLNVGDNMPFSYSFAVETDILLRPGGFVEARVYGATSGNTIGQRNVVVDLRPI